MAATSAKMIWRLLVVNVSKMSKYPAKLRNSQHLSAIGTHFIVNNCAIFGFIIVF